jgi:hypothetical protein
MLSLALASLLPFGLKQALFKMTGDKIVPALPSAPPCRWRWLDALRVQDVHSSIARRAAMGREKMRLTRRFGARGLLCTKSPGLHLTDGRNCDMKTRSMTAADFG